MKSPRTTYILATFNRAKFLEKAFRNIREYIEPEDEFIVIDGGSTDGTLELIESNRDIVTTVVSEPDFGEAHAYNKGLLLAKGKYIKLISDDDYYYPSAMRYAVKTLDTYPEIDALQCGGEHFVFDDKRNKMELQYYSWLPSSIKWNETVKNIFYFKINCGLGLWLTKKVVARVGLLDTSFRATDTEYMARLIFHKVNYKFLNIKLYRHITYPHSGKQLRNEIRRDLLRLMIRYNCLDINRDMFYPKKMYSLEALAQSSGILQPDLVEMIKIIYLVNTIKKHSIFNFTFGKLSALIGRIIWAAYPRLKKLNKVLRQNVKNQKISSKGLTCKPVWDRSLC